MGDNKILAQSKATFPCPIITTFFVFKLTFSDASSGTPLYQPTNLEYIMKIN